MKSTVMEQIDVFTSLVGGPVMGWRLQKDSLKWTTDGRHAADNDTLVTILPVPSTLNVMVDLQVEKFSSSSQTKSLFHLHT